MVPEGWTQSTIGEHVDLLTGFAFRSAQYTSDENDVRLLRGDNIAQGCLRWRDAKRWRKENVQELDRYQLRAGDFVIAMDRTWIPAGVKISEVSEDDLPCLLVQRVSRLRSKESLEQALLRQIFSSHRFEQYVKKVQTETAVPHISPADIRGFPVLVPPLEEQTKIAEILSTWDRAIEAVEKLIENSERQKNALMRQLLSASTRCSDCAGAWKYGSFSELFLVANNKSTQVKSSDYLDDGRSPIVDQGKSLVAGWTDARDIYSDVPVIVFGDHTRVVKWVNFPFAPGADGTQVLKTQPSLDPRFGYFVLLNSDIPNLGYSRHMRELKNIKFYYPVNVDEQQKIVAILANAETACTSLQYERENLHREKTALMQQLLTGKRRVKVDGDVDRIVKEAAAHG